MFNTFNQYGPISYIILKKWAFWQYLIGLQGQRSPKALAWHFDDTFCLGLESFIIGSYFPFFLVLTPSLTASSCS
jgi:hypothetical protein